MSDRSVQIIPGDRRCTARSKRSGERCERWASPGHSVCRMHGGATPSGPGTGAPVKHGLYSKCRKYLADAIEGLNDPDLGEELAITRAALVRLQEKFTLDEAVTELDILDTLLKLVDHIRKVSEAMTKPKADLSVVVVRLEETRFAEALARILIEVGGVELAATVAERLADECPELSLGM